LRCFRRYTRAQGADGPLGDGENTRNAIQRGAGPVFLL